MHVVEKEFKNFIEKTSYKNYYIAYSGGVDSQVLFFLSKKYLKDRLTALHVNHGISKNSNKWESFCKKTAIESNVLINIANFDLKRQNSNLESIARDLRYEFFEKNMSNEDALMTGHHLDDQAETFMLRLMRGSGVDGLASMDSERKLNKGVLIRPLLRVTKEEIYDFAIKNNLKWVEDESNLSSDYDRNFIRNKVIPLLNSRWKKANKSIARSAVHCLSVKKEMEISDEKLLGEVLDIGNKKVIIVKKLKKLSIDNQKRVLRYWLKTNKEKMPSEKNLNILINEVIESKAVDSSMYKTKDYEIRKSFGKLYYIKDLDKELHLINFNMNDCFKIVKDVKKLKMKHKGRLKAFNQIMKEERIPNWKRSRYIAFVNSLNEVVAFGDIKSS